MKMREICLAMMVGFLYGVVSNDDYEIEVQENEYWCQMIAEGTWYADHDEIARRCPDGE